MLFSPCFHTHYEYSQQIEREGCGRFLQAGEKTWCMPSATSTACQYNSLSAYFLDSFCRIILWSTPTVLLSLMTSFLTFKRPAYRRPAALLFVSSESIHRVACDGWEHGKRCLHATAFRSYHYDYPSANNSLELTHPTSDKACFC